MIIISNTYHVAIINTSYHVAIINNTYHVAIISNTYTVAIGVGRVIFRMQKIEIYRRPATLGSDLIYTILVWTCSL